ncbi:DELTA-alicitoxin-Pse1b-like [Sphaeramia orbicularis]|uniref:DELTA-alicitoxin-Pse1b-like n=1 Tax=Sphaeramia orbicularis TaxID=375764 RepID=A0A673A091_9TELE|nr:DELTA-alicitoxin-Pse1b-like [Sphaeramia orbicularis]
MANAVGAAASTLGAVVAASEAIAAAAPTHRQCNVEITNACKKYSLCNPRMHLYSGQCVIPQSPFVDSGTSDVAVFVKTPNAARGSVGIITYDLQNNKTKKSCMKMAVMFSVPYDFNIYSNVYAVGIFDKRKECNKALYNEMMDGSPATFARKEAREPGSLIYKGGTFTIMATMSDAYQPVIKLRIIETD